MKKILLDMVVAVAIISSTSSVVKADELKVDDMLTVEKLQNSRKVENGWEYNSDFDNWYYYRGGEKQTGWQWIDGNYYYLGNNSSGTTYYGAMVTGYQRIGIDIYYLRPNGTMLTGWKNNAGKFEYFGTNGIRYEKEWLKENNEWYYFDFHGDMVKGREEIGNKDYYFNANGGLHTGWLGYYNNDGEYMYEYYSPTSKSSPSIDGNVYGERYESEWLYDNGSWYYFHSGGDMVRGKRRIDAKEYLFYNSGAMLTGWYNDGEWSYYGTNGVRYDNTWLYEEGNWYYFDSSGDMVTDSRYISGILYDFNSSGVMQ